jgi:hypothetical protein
MASEAELHVGDEGTILRFTITEDGTALDVSSGSPGTLILAKKDKSFILRDTEFLTDGKDGIVQYTTIEDDIDTKGDWKAQIYLELPGGKWHTSIAEFSVEDNLDA